MKIQYTNGIIEIRLGQKFVLIRELNQVYLVSKLLKYYRDNSPNEKIFHMCVGMIDLFNSARTKFIRDRELQCIRNLLSIPESEPNMLN